MGYKISPTLARELQMGQLLIPPDDAITRPSSDPDQPEKRWFETFIIRDIEFRSDGTEGQPSHLEIIQLLLTVPADVVSKSQGLSAPCSIRFPWGERANGNDRAEYGCSRSWQDFAALLRAVGLDTGVVTNPDGSVDLEMLPCEDIRNMRVTAQVRHAPDDSGRVWQNIGRFRAPK